MASETRYPVVTSLASTDYASAILRLNDLLARVRAHGLIA